MLAGCASTDAPGGSGNASDGGSKGATTDLASQGASLARHLPAFDESAVETRALQVTASAASVLSKYEQFESRTDWFAGLSSVDGSDADWVVNAFEQNAVVAAVDVDPDAVGREVTSKGLAKMDAEGEFDVYGNEQALVGVSERHVLVAAPGDHLSLSKRDLLATLVTFVSGEGEALPASDGPTRTLLDHVDVEHLLYVERLLSGTYPGDATDRVPGASGFVAGGTAVDGGSAFRREAAAYFPEDVNRDAFEAWLDDVLAPQEGAGDRSVARDGQVLVGKRTYPLEQRSTTANGTTGSRTTLPPADHRVKVVGSQFEWRFSYPDVGVSDRQELVLPVGESVSLEATSADVIHALSIPPLGVRVDAVPGQVTKARVTPTETGQYTAYCSEFCGAGHAQMTAPVRVVPTSEFENWL